MKVPSFLPKLLRLHFEKSGEVLRHDVEAIKQEMSGKKQSLGTCFFKAKELAVVCLLGSIEPPTTSER